MNFLSNREERLKKAGFCSNNYEDKKTIQKLLNDLDPDQKEAVKALFKDTLVIANAGSGKTRVFNLSCWLSYC